jgi:hypothetical protein
MRLIVVPIRSETWSTPAMQHAVEQLHDAARRIRKRVDLVRERTRFTIACDTIEELALQQRPTNAIGFDGDRASGIIAALPRDGEAVFPIAEGDDLPRLRALIGDSNVEGMENALALVAVMEPHPGSTRFRVDGISESSLQLAPIRKPAPTTSASPSAPRRQPLDYLVDRALGRGTPIPWIDASHTAVVAALRDRLFVEEVPMRTIDVPVRRTVVDEATWAGIERSLWYRIRKALLPFLLPKSKPTMEIEVTERRTVPAPFEPQRVPVTFQDGSTSVGFPLRALAPTERPSGFPVMRAALISTRHLEMDKQVDVAVLRNAEISRRGDVSFAEQEALAFDRGHRFFEDCLRHADGLEVHLFHTGLEPAVLGVYRAIVEVLRDDSIRGRFVVEPRVLRGGGYDSLEAWF